MDTENLDSSGKQVESPGYELYDAKDVKLQKLGTDLNYRHEIVKKTILIYGLLHIGGLYGLYMIITGRSKFLTFLWGFFVGMISSQGIMLGAHRGYAHNSFKMTTTGQLLLIILQTMSGQYDIYWWVRDHRLHHKFCDTDADPYNASRGFFFSHIGWLMTNKHPLIAAKGKTLDLSDLQTNKLIMFQRKYYIPLFFLFCMIIPIAVPIYCWNETLWNAFFIPFLSRYMVTLNMTWCINSVAHWSGSQEFDKRISARQSFWGNIISLGEGWHNYHHTFPWDSTFSEFGKHDGLSTKILHFLQKLKLVYDLKKASRKLVFKHSVRHGDGTFGTEQSRWSGKEVM